MKILIVEDEIRLAEALQQILVKFRHHVDLEHDGESGLNQALTGFYDVIVLDIMLPKRNGIDTLKQLRAEGISTPVLLLTARDEAADKVNGLDAGADDYLTKPFHTEELLARIRALGRRKDMPFREDVVHFGDTTLKLSTYELCSGEQNVRLGLKEFRIMEILMNNGPRIASKEDMITRVWGYESEAEYNNLEVYISFLRKKLSHLHAKIAIRSIRGVGYTLSENNQT